jgi:hypothetical protein
VIKRRLYQVLVLFLWPAILAAQDDVIIKIGLDRDTISINEEARLKVSITGTKQQGQPDLELPNLTMFNIYSQGTSTSISYVNGAMTASYTYQYILRPQRTGTFPIKPVSLVIDRRRYVSNELILTVVGGGASSRAPGQTQSAKPTAAPTEAQSGDIFLRAEVNKKTAYVNEQITLTVKFYHAVQLLSQPEYTAPQTTDFWTNIIEAQKSYYEIIGNQRYKVEEITTALFPTRSGDLNIGSAMVNVMIPQKRAARRDDPFSMFDNIFAQGEQKPVRSRPITLNILPLPANNKPSDFGGTVGNYTISATADKTTADVNQPVTVTYKISGTGNIKTIAEPNIGDSQDFRVYRASSDEKISTINGLLGGTKIFEETFIPKRAGKLIIPGVKLDFFDPGSKKYRMIMTDTIELAVRPAEAGEYVDAPLSQVPGRVVESNAKDILYIKAVAGELKGKETLIIFTPFYMILNAIPVFLLAAVIINNRRRRKLRSDIGYARSRAAKKLARKHLSSAGRLAQANQTAAFYAEVRRAIFSYVADKLNISQHGLTGDRLLEIFGESNIDTNIMEGTRELLRRADFAQYSSSQAPQEQINESLRLAEELLMKLEEAKIG